MKAKTISENHMEETKYNESSNSTRNLAVYPKMINHVAVSVPDLNQAIKWYNEVLGFTIVAGPVELVIDDSVVGRAFRDIHGSDLKKLRLAWISSGNQIGLEILEYIEPRAQKRQANFEYWKSGFTHICITDPNIEDLFKKISESGGKQRSKLWEMIPGYKVAYCEDPFGNIIELLSNGFEKTMTAFA